MTTPQPQQTDYSQMSYNELIRQRDMMLQQQEQQQEEELKILQNRKQYLEYILPKYEFAGSPEEWRDLQFINARRAKRVKRDRLRTEYSKMKNWETVGEWDDVKRAELELLNDDKELDETKDADRKYVDSWMYRKTDDPVRNIKNNKRIINAEKYRQWKLDTETGKEKYYRGIAREIRDLGATADIDKYIQDIPSDDIETLKKMMSEEVVLDKDWQYNKKMDMGFFKYVTKGLGTGTDKIVEGIAEETEELFGSTDYQIKEISDENGVVLQDEAERRRNLVQDVRAHKRMLESTLWNDSLRLQVADAITGTIPMLAMSAATGDAFTPIMAYSEAQEMEKMYRDAGFEGNNQGKAILTAIPYAFVEKMQMDKLMNSGALKKMATQSLKEAGKEVSEKALKQSIRDIVRTNTKEAFKKAIKQYGINQVNEVTEEMLQQLIQDTGVLLFDKLDIAGGGDVDIDTKKWLSDAIQKQSETAKIASLSMPVLGLRGGMVDVSNIVSAHNLQSQVIDGIKNKILINDKVIPVEPVTVPVEQPAKPEQSRQDAIIAPEQIVPKKQQVIPEQSQTERQGEVLPPDTPKTGNEPTTRAYRGEIGRFETKQKAVKADVAVHPISKIVNQIIHDNNIKLDKGYTNGEKAIAKIKDNVIRISNKAAGNLPIALHEFGHILNKNKVYTKPTALTQEMIRELEVLSSVDVEENNNGMPINSDDVIEEGFAQWFAYYMYDRNEAMAVTPAFTQHFESILQEQDYVDKILQYQNWIDNYYSTPINERPLPTTRQDIEPDVLPRDNRRVWWEKVFNAIAFNLHDPFRPLTKMNNETRRIRDYFRGTQLLAMSLTDSAIRNSLLGVRDLDGNKVGIAFYDVFSMFDNVDDELIEQLHKALFVKSIIGERKYWDEKFINYIGDIENKFRLEKSKKINFDERIATAEFTDSEFAQRYSEDFDDFRKAEEVIGYDDYIEKNEHKAYYTYEQAEEIAQELEQSNINNKLPDFYNKFQQYTNSLLEVSYRAGLLNEEQMKSITDRHPFYVPMLKISRSNVHYLAERSAGNEEPIQNIIHSVMENTSKMYQAAYKNVIHNKMYNFANTHTDMGDFVEVIDDEAYLSERIDTGAVANVFQTELEKKMVEAKKKGELSIEAEQAFEYYSMIDNMITEKARGGEFGIRMFHPVKTANKDQNIVAFKVNGKTTLLQYNDDLYKMFELMSWNGKRDTGRAIIDYFMNYIAVLPKKILQWGAVSGNPGFIAVNIIRDYQAYWINSVFPNNKKFQALLSPFVNMKDFIRLEMSRENSVEKDNPALIIYQMLGGLNVEYSTGETAEKKQNQKLNKLIERGNKKSTVRRIGKGIISSITSTEVGSRAAEFKNRLLNHGYTDDDLRKFIETGKGIPFDVLLEAKLAAQDITGDFGTSGELIRSMNRYIPFLNAMVQGSKTSFLKKFNQWAKQAYKIKNLKGKAKKDAVIKLGLNIGTSLAPLMAYTFVSWFMQKDSDCYKELPAGLKYNYWITGFDENCKPLGRIPRAHGWGTVTAMFEKALNTVYNYSDESERGFIAEIWEAHGYENVGQSAVGSTPGINVLWQINGNKNAYGYPIYDDYKPTKLQIDEHTSQIAIWLASLTGSSPQKVDYAIEQSTGNWSKYVTEPLDFVYGHDTDVLNTYLTSRITVSKPLFQSKKIFYERWKELKDRKAYEKEGIETPSEEDKLKHDIEYKKINTYKLLMKKIQKLSEDKNGKIDVNKRIQYEKYLGGLARKALGYDEYELLPDVFKATKTEIPDDLYILIQKEKMKYIKSLKTMRGLKRIKDRNGYKQSYILGRSRLEILKD